MMVHWNMSELKKVVTETTNIFVFAPYLGLGKCILKSVVPTGRGQVGIVITVFTTVIKNGMKMRPVSNDKKLHEG
jgi:hypothetical protein